MPWGVQELMSLRKEFVLMAVNQTANISSLCKKYGISRKTGYKWLNRYKDDGILSLQNRSTRPHNSPLKTEASVESEIIKLRKEHPTWGGRKIKQRLLNLGIKSYIPHPSTITDILKRSDLIDQVESDKRKEWIRFERMEPNELWQMDFKGHFGIENGRCHPLTILDDHSRFSVAIRACLNEMGTTVKEHLISVFRQYGMPYQINVDNGPPWGAELQSSYTQLSAWIMRLGITVSYSHPYHPQTNGKDERFHRTLKEDLIERNNFKKLMEWQSAFDRYRDEYNCIRPHEALGLKVPASSYCPSKRHYKENLTEIEYYPGDIIKKVHPGGRIKFRSQEFKVGKAFTGNNVALRPEREDGCWGVYFCRQKIRILNEKNQTSTIFITPAKLNDGN